MAQKFSSISERHAEFIARQKMFIVGTAAAEGRINISPKGMDSFRVLSGNRVAWLNVTGSGNESAAHVVLNPRMTVMFCAFEGPPLILRLYGNARVVHSTSPDWQALYSLFPEQTGARQIFEMEVDLVQSSCGMAVPYYTYDRDRDLLREWADKKGASGIREYWAQKNRISLDGFPTHIEACIDEQSAASTCGTETTTEEQRDGDSANA